MTTDTTKTAHEEPAACEFCGRTKSNRQHTPPVCNNIYICRDLLLRRFLAAESALAAERARVVAAEAMVEDACKLIERSDSAHTHEAKRILASRPAEQAKDSAPSGATVTAAAPVHCNQTEPDGGVDSPAEPKRRPKVMSAKELAEKYGFSEHHGGTWEQVAFAADKAAEDCKDEARVYLGLKHEAEAERDDLKRQLEEAKVQASAVDPGELEHLREAAELLRMFEADDHEWSRPERAWLASDKKRATERLCSDASSPTKTQIREAALVVRHQKRAAPVAEERAAADQAGSFQERLITNSAEAVAVAREGLKLYGRIAEALDRLAPVPIHERGETVTEEPAAAQPSPAQEPAGFRNFVTAIIVDSRVAELARAAAESRSGLSETWLLLALAEAAEAGAKGMR